MDCWGLEMRICVLGSVGVWVDGEWVGSLSPQTRRLLAMMVSMASDSLSPQQIGEYLTAGACDGSRIRTAVSRLRKVLGTGVVTDAGGYRLVLDDEHELDAARFEALVVGARKMPLAERRDTLIEALALWRGDAFAEFADEAWAQGVAARLNERHVTAVEDLAETLIDLGCCDEAVLLIEPQLELFEYRERPIALLMRALAGDGRLTDALRAFQRFRTVLREDIGVSPTSELCALEASLFLEAPFREAEVRVGLGPPPHVLNLPHSRTELIGRDREAADVLATLGQHRLVTLTGPGGCGKTRLAVHIARTATNTVADEIYFVDLARLGPGDDVVVSIASSLGVDGAIDDVIAALSGRRVLVILDNCEHVLESLVPAVFELVGSVEALRVLATSRARLDLTGEALYRVQPLGVPQRGAKVGDVAASDAVKLFVSRAHLVAHGFELTPETAPWVRDVCRRVEGLPLAIELAAARLHVLDVRELAERLERDMGQLGAGSHLTAGRHRTQRAAVDWSFQLLAPDDRRLLCELAAFRGGCDIEAAEACCEAAGVDQPEIDALSRLIDCSLAHTTHDGGTTRFHLHEVIREFALESASPEDREQIFERHARYFAALADRLGAGPADGQERGWLRRHTADNANFIAASNWLQTHDPSAALRLLVRIERGCGFTAEGHWLIDHVRAVLPGALEGAPADRARALVLMAFDAQPDMLDRAYELVAEAERTLNGSDDPMARTYILSIRVLLDADRDGGRLNEAGVRAALGACDETGNAQLQIETRRELANRAHPALSEALQTEALRIAEDHCFDLFAALARAELIIVPQFRGDSARVLRLSRAVAPTLDDIIHFCPAAEIEFCPLAAGEHGELSESLQLAEHLLQVVTNAPHDPHIVGGLASTVAHLSRLAGDRRSAERSVTLALQSFASKATNFISGLALITRSALWRDLGQPERAAATMVQSQLNRRIEGVTDIEMRNYEELAAIAHALDRRRHAADLLATAEHARHRDAKPCSPACRPELDALRRSLDGATGQPLIKSQVKAIAIELADRPAGHQRCSCEHVLDTDGRSSSLPL